MTDWTIEKVKELRKGITSGKWKPIIEDDTLGGKMWWVTNEDDIQIGNDNPFRKKPFMVVGDEVAEEESTANAEFIAASPGIVDFLLAEIERLKKKCAEYYEDLRFPG